MAQLGELNRTSTLQRSAWFHKPETSGTIPSIQLEAEHSTLELYILPFNGTTVLDSLSDGWTKVILRQAFRLAGISKTNQRMETHTLILSQGMLGEWI
jgi:hypothetical protein